MALLEDLLDLASKLDPAAKPVIADVPDLLAAVIHTLDAVGIRVPPGAEAYIEGSPAPAAPPAPGTPPPAAATSETPAEPPTEGSLVADVAPKDTPPPSDPLAPGDPTAPVEPNTGATDPLAGYTVRELTDELAKRQSEAVQVADANKTEVQSGP